MANEKLLGLTAVSAVTESMKMNQKFPQTGETFDPFRGDAQDFTLQHERTQEIREEIPLSERRMRAVLNEARSGDTSPRMEPEPMEGPRPEDRLRTPKANTAVTPRPSLAAGLNARSLRRALVLSEILSPPLSLRGRGQGPGIR